MKDREIPSAFKLDKDDLPANSRVAKLGITSLYFARSAKEIYISLVYGAHMDDSIDLHPSSTYKVNAPESITILSEAPLLGD